MDVRVRSCRVVRMLLLLLGGPRLARELAESAGVRSNHVIGYLGYWIRRGYVVYVDTPLGRMYMLTPRGVELARRVKAYADMLRARGSSLC